MTAKTRDRSCDARIADHLESRMSDFGALADLADAWRPHELLTLLEDRSTRELFCELTTAEMWADASAVPQPCHAETIASMDPDTLGALLEDFDVDALREAADERMHETPLAVSSYTVFRVDLSTGGPADWLEVRCTGDTPAHEPAGEGEHFEVDTITYHFADWFDHAERQLTDRDFESAGRFVARVVPELMS
jgi:uncharacterized protein YheU (UPF0270 family)